MASVPPTASDDGFDASKQAKTPAKFLRNAPKDAPAVRVGFVSAAVGYGLFAARDLSKDEFIFHEAPLLTALFNENFSTDKSLTLSQYAAYRSALLHNHAELTVAYPRIAAGNGVRVPPFDDARAVLEATLGKFLVHGRFAGSTVTHDQYDAYTSRLNVAAVPSEDACRKACLDFFRHYAFETKKAPTALVPAAAIATGALPASPLTGTGDACIYLLGSLVNHCCTPPATASSRVEGPNCSWRVGPSGLAQFVLPKHICVQARRDIKEGEQLTWDYGKREKGFVCECATCRDNFVSHHCRVL